MMAAWRTVVGTMAPGGRTRAVGRWTGRVTDVRRFTSGANAGAVGDVGDALNRGAATEACRACPSADPQLELPGRSGRRRCSGTVKVASDLVRLEDGLDHLHAAATSLAALDVDREDARAQTSPC